MADPPASGGETVTSPDWTERAACRGSDPAVFVEPTSDTHVVDALRTCARCPVARDCLDTALAHDQIGDIGIWGGTTPDVRDQIRAGTLTRDDARHLQTGPFRAPNAAAPMVAVTPDGHGDFIDATGQVLITRLPAGDFVAFIDQRPVARAPTLSEACQAAHTAQTATHAAQPRRRPPSPALIETQLDDHGDHVDPSGRVVITRVPTAPTYLVFIDDRLLTRAETLNSARAAAQAFVHREAKPGHSTTSQHLSMPAAGVSKQTPQRPRRARNEAVAERGGRSSRGRPPDTSWSDDGRSSAARHTDPIRR